MPASWRTLKSKISPIGRGPKPSSVVGSVCAQSPSMARCMITIREHTTPSQLRPRPRPGAMARTMGRGAGGAEGRRGRGGGAPEGQAGDAGGGVGVKDGVLDLLPPLQLPRPPCLFHLLEDGGRGGVARGCGSMGGRRRGRGFKENVTPTVPPTASQQTEPIACPAQIPRGESSDNNGFFLKTMDVPGGCPRRPHSPREEKGPNARTLSGGEWAVYATDSAPCG